MARLTVADLTIDDFKTLIREVVAQTLSEMFGDPDEGLELKDDFQLELQQSLAAAKAGAKTTPACDAVKKLGLTW